MSFRVSQTMYRFLPSDVWHPSLISCKPLDIETFCIRAPYLVNRAFNFTMMRIFAIAAFSRKIQSSDSLMMIRIQRLADSEIFFLNIFGSLIRPLQKIAKLFRKGLELSFSKSSLKFQLCPHLFAQFLQILSPEPMVAPSNELPAPAVNYDSQIEPSMVRV